MTVKTDLVRAQQRFARRQRSVRRRGWLPWLVGGIVAVVAGAAVWVVFASSWLAVAGVEVDGATTVPRDTVLDRAQVPVGRPLARVDLTGIADRVRAVPAVADARVTRSWPDRIVIRVTERVPVVVVSEGSRHELVDAGGVAFRTVPSRPAGLPQAVVSGSRRDVTVRSVVTVSAALPAELRGRVVSITATSPDSITLNLASGVRVVWGSADESPRKATVLTALMRREAKVYDVSAPDLPVTQGEKK